MNNFFASIKWRFILIYLLLVAIVMGIVGAFIINRLEIGQVSRVQEEMEETVQSIVNSSTFLRDKAWEDQGDRIQNTLDEWRLSSQEAIYVVAAGKPPKIVASSVNTRKIIEGENAYTYKVLKAPSLMEALEGEKVHGIEKDPNSQLRSDHYIYPVTSKEGEVLGAFYMVSDLSAIDRALEDARLLLTYGTLLAIFVTMVLGYALANSITEPIHDVTQKAEEMAQGKFDQRVEVKSKDEIGQLGSMFNYLAEELDETIERMDTERSKLDTIFNYMVEGVIAVDRRGRLIHANPVAREILGLEPMDLDLDKYWDLGQLNIRDLNYFDAQSLSGTSQLEIKGRFYNVRYAPYKSEMGRNAGLIVVFQDITREHNLDLMRKEFVANVSHELKTPITTIKSYTETLMRVDLDGGGRQRFLTIINRETDRMSHLVTDLLQLSNLDAQRTHWDLVALDPYEMVTQAAESIKPLVDEKKHRLHLDIPMDLGPFYGDRHGTSQILVNILSNAAKYTTYGGDIRVRGRLSSEEDFIDIEVRDTGIGIPQKDLRRIFERFYRVEKGRSRAAGGTGLGLAIAKEIMESMGGRISIQSKFGVGTAVLLQFPTSKGGDL